MLRVVRLDAPALSACNGIAQVEAWRRHGVGNPANLGGPTGSTGSVFLCCLPCARLPYFVANLAELGLSLG